MLLQPLFFFLNQSHLSSDSKANQNFTTFVVWQLWTIRAERKTEKINKQHDKISFSVCLNLDITGETTPAQQFPLPRLVKMNSIERNSIISIMTLSSRLQHKPLRWRLFKWKKTSMMKRVVLPLPSSKNGTVRTRQHDNSSKEETAFLRLNGQNKPGWRFLKYWTAWEVISSTPSKVCQLEHKEVRCCFFHFFLP